MIHLSSPGSPVAILCVVSASCFGFWHPSISPDVRSLSLPAVQQMEAITTFTSAEAVSSRFYLSYADTWNIYWNSRLVAREALRVRRACQADNEEISMYECMAKEKHRRIAGLALMSFVDNSVRKAQYGPRMLWFYGEQIAVLDHLADVSSDAGSLLLAKRLA